MDKFWYNNDDLTKRHIHNIVNETLRAYEYQNRIYAHKMLCSSFIIIFTEHNGKQTKLLVSIENENRSSTVEIITE
jgi:hypothetical protein